MRETILLLKKDIIQFFPFILNYKEFFKNKKNLKKILFFILIASSVLLGFFTMTKMLESMYDAFASQGHEKHFLVLISTGYTFMLIMFVLPYSISRLYYSKDTESLLCLPIKGKSIMMSKILFLSTTFPFVIVFFVLPVMIRFAKKLENSIIYYIFNIINLIAFGFIITSIMILICVLLMRVINKFPRARNMLQLFGLLAIFIFAISFQGLIQSSNLKSTAEMTGNMLKTYENINPILNYFYPLRMLADSLASGSDSLIMKNTLINTALAVILLNSVVFLSFNVWLKGVFSSKSSPKVKVNKKTLSSLKSYKSKSTVLSIVKREIVCILKTPIYLFNIGMMSILMVVASCIPVYMSMKNMNISLSEINKIGEAINHIPVDFVNLLSIAFVIGIGIGAFLTIGGSSASSSITREGKNLWLMLVLPISGKEQVLGRMLASTIISIVGILPIIILISFLIKPSVFLIISLFFGMLLSANLISTYSLFIDILKPKLDWDNPQQAIKQNFNIILTMIIDIMYIGGIVSLGVFLFESNYLDQKNFYLGAIGLLIFHLITEFIFYRLSIKMWNKNITRYKIK